MEDEYKFFFCVDIEIKLLNGIYLYIRGFVMCFLFELWIVFFLICVCRNDRKFYIVFIKEECIEDRYWKVYFSFLFFVMGRVVV